MKAIRWIPEIFVVALAIVLRVPGLSNLQLTLNESRILLFASDTWEHLRRLFLIGADVHFGGTFAYVLFAKSLGYLGDILFFSRLASVFFGIASIIAVYFLVRRIFGTGAARITALLIAIFPYHVLASRMVGVSAAGLFFAVVTMYLFWRIFEGEVGISLSVAFTLTMLIGMNLYYYNAMLFLPMNILFFGFGRERLKNLSWWIPVNLVLAGLCAYWMRRWSVAFFTPSTMGTFTGDMIQQGVLIKEGFVNLQFKLLFLEKYLEFLYVLGGFFSGIKLLNGWSVLGSILLPFVFHYFPFSGFREYEDGYRPRLFSIVFLTGILAAASALSFSSMHSGDYLLPAAVVFHMVCSHGAVKFARWRSNAILVLMILCILFGFVPTVKKAEMDRADWQKAVNVIKEKGNIQTPVVFINGWISTPVLYYAPELKDRFVNLFPNIDLEFVEAGRYRQEEILPLMNGFVDSYPPNGIREAMLGTGDMWVIYSTSRGVEVPKHTHEYEVWIMGNAEKVEDFDLGGEVHLSRYVPKIK